MASLLKLKTDIKKLKAAIASKATSGAIKTKLRGKLTTLENELDKLQPNKRKPKTTGPKSESALVRIAKKRRTNQGLSTSKSDIERDAIRPAMPAGRRISANGNRYYEYRDNRVDTRQPPKKYRKLADGGHMADGGEVEISEIPRRIKYLDYDGDPNDLRLHYQESRTFGAENKEDYEDATEQIDKIEYKGNGWKLYVVYDTSGYQYWMKSQEEQNYMQITIAFDKDTIDKAEVPKIEAALMEAVNDIEDISDRYDYIPSDDDYKHGGKTQGYDDKKDESLGMTRGKLSLKDFVGNRKQKEHARRDDARFEERGKMADGGTLKEKDKFSLKILRSLSGFSSGIGIGGVLEILGYSKYRFNQYATQEEYDKVKKELDNLVKKDYVEGSTILYKITKKGAEYLSSFGYGDYMAKGGKTKDQEVVRGYFEDEAYEYADGGMVEKLKKEFASKDLDDDLNMDGYHVEIFDYKEEAEKDRFIKKNSKDNYLVPWDSDDDNYYIVVVPKNKMDHGGSVDYKLEVINQYSDEKLARIYSQLNDYDYSEILSEIKGDPAERKHIVSKIFKEVVERDNQMADGGSVAKGNYEMLLSQAKEVMHHAEELMQVAKPDMDIEAWVVAKAERATTDLSDITHYLDGLKMAMGGMVKHNAHKVNA